MLEIGIGSGLNMPFYGTGAKELIGLDPSAQLLAMARRAAPFGLPVEFIEGSAEAIPLDDASIDTVLTTWTLCSIPDAARALREMWLENSYMRGPRPWTFMYQGCARPR